MRERWQLRVTSRSASVDQIGPERIFMDDKQRRSTTLLNNSKIYIFVLSIASFILSAIFAFLGSNTPFVGFLFVSLICMVMLFPNVIEYIKMPGVELRQRVEQVKHTAEEIKLLASKLAEVSLRLGFKNEGWGGYDVGTTEYKNSLSKISQELLQLAGTSIEKEKELYDFYKLYTRNEYAAYIINSTMVYREGAPVRRKVNIATYIHPNEEQIPSPDELEKALEDSEELDARRKRYIELYRHFIEHGTHLSEGEWFRRYEWVGNKH